jgi:hypothetical protein
MYYQTYDLNLAGYICASGIQLVTHTTDGTRTTFCFDKTPELQQLVEDYYQMKAVINPLHYGSALKILKNIIYQKNNNYDNQQFSHQSRKTK